MVVASARKMKIFPTPTSYENLKHYPHPMSWPVLGDWQGCYDMIEAVMTDDLDALYELTLRFPEHTFGFEELLTRYNRSGEVAERLILRTVPLPREHRFDVEMVRLLDNSVQVLGIVRRGEKKISIETFYDSRTDTSADSLDGDIAAGTSIAATMATASK